MKYTYKPKGVCSTLMEADIENNIIKSIEKTHNDDENLDKDGTKSNPNLSLSSIVRSGLSAGIGSFV